MEDFLVVMLAIVVFAFVFGWVGFTVRSARGPIHSSGLADLFRSIKVWHLCLAVAVVLWTIGGPRRHPSENLIVLVIPAVLLVFVSAWNREFQFLMALGDGEFPGRHDKLIWAVLLIALAPIGVWVFRSYRLVHWPKPDGKRAEAAGDWA